MTRGGRTVLNSVLIILSTLASPPPTPPAPNLTIAMAKRLFSAPEPLPPAFSTTLLSPYDTRTPSSPRLSSTISSPCTSKLTPMLSSSPSVPPLLSFRTIGSRMLCSASSCGLREERFQR
jgi:hypothetical protein